MKKTPGQVALGAAVLLVLPLFAATPAGAYVRTTTEGGRAMAWERPLVDLLIYTGNLPPFLNEAVFVGAVVASADTWSTPAVPCTSLQFRISSVAAADGPVAFDRINHITFRTDEWRKKPCDPTSEPCNLHDSRAIALTTVWAQRGDGKIVDADMELNGVGFRWTDVVVDGNNRVGPERAILHDVQNVVTHELGHLVGLDHNCYDPRTSPRVPIDHAGVPAPHCDSASLAVREATMFVSATNLDVNKRDLTADDQQAVCDIYPAGRVYPVVDDEETGGCALAGGRRPRSPAAWWLFSLGALGALFLKRRRR